MNIDHLVWRETDASRLNAVLNDPEVRPWVADLDVGMMDVRALVADRTNVLLMGEHGGTLFFRIAPGYYEAHTQVVPAGRGRWVREFVRAAVHWMFTRSDAYEIVTRIPTTHTGAVMAALWAGGRKHYELAANARVRGERYDVMIYRLNIEDWVMTAPRLAQIGALFHGWMNELARQRCLLVEPHGDEPVHDRYVGAAIEMATHGRPQKAELFYNISAAVMRKPQIKLLDASGLIFRMDLGIVRLRADDDPEFLGETRDVAA